MCLYLYIIYHNIFYDFLYVILFHQPGFTMLSFGVKWWKGRSECELIPNTPWFDGNRGTQNVGPIHGLCHFSFSLMYINRCVQDSSSNGLTWWFGDRDSMRASLEFQNHQPKPPANKTLNSFVRKDSPSSP